MQGCPQGRGLQFIKCARVTHASVGYVHVQNEINKIKIKVLKPLYGSHPIFWVVAMAIIRIVT